MPLWNNIDELMDYYIPPMPSTYWIDIVRTCNLRCVMCPQSKGLSRRDAKMPMPLFRDIIDQICQNRPLVKLYLSGEPLLHERLFDMIDYATAHNCTTMIHTNGTLLTEAVTEKLLASNLTSISISFDGCSPEIYEQLRPPARFDKVQSNIHRYLQRRKANHRGPHCTIEIIRMRQTCDLIDDFVKRWKAAGADAVHVTEYMTWLGSVEDRRVQRPGTDEKYSPCEAPFRHGCILSDGTVVPCCMDVNGKLPLGNVTRNHFLDLWAGNDYRQLRLQMLAGDLPIHSICRRCDNTKSTRPPTRPT